MKWFFNLKRAFRVLIAVLAWLPLIVASVLMSESIGDNGENMQWWQALLILVFLAVPIVFDVFAIVARKREKSAKNAANSTPPPDFSTSQTSPAVTPILAPQETDKKVTLKDFSYSNTPDLIIKLTRNGSTDMQTDIGFCNVGDEVTIDYDYDKDLYVCNAGYDIGYLSEKDRDKIKDNSRILIDDISLNDNDKYVVKIAVYYPQDNKTMDLPVHTKIRGVTFEGRQKHIAESKESDTLIIKHSPTNDYPNTIAIINERTGKNLGNIGNDLANALLATYGTGCAFVGQITEITGGNGNHYGCNIVIKALK